MKPVSVLLDFVLAAGENKTFGAPATQVYCKSRTADVQFRILDTNKNTLTDWFTVIAGQGLSIDSPGGSVEFRSIAGGTFSFQVTVGDFIDNSFVFAGGNVSITPSPTTLSEYAGVVVGAGLCVSVAPAVTSVRQRWVRNSNTTSAKDGYLRSDNVAEPSGIKVFADDVVIVQSENELFFYNASDAAITVYVSDELTA